MSGRTAMWRRWIGVACILLAVVGSARAAEEMAEAVVRIRPEQRSAYRIPRFITGKFAEHLGSNIYNGMSAQVVRNPTLGEFPFWTGAMDSDGRTMFHSEPEKIAGEIRRLARRLAWPDADIERLIQDRNDGLAFWWIREGSRNAVRVSPDVGLIDRAQRVEIRAAGQGIAQWMHLPLHRARNYEWTLVVRSPGLKALRLSLTAAGANESAARAEAAGVGPEWRTIRGKLALPASAPADALYRLAVTGADAGQFVLSRILLQPTDHVNGADPDVVRLLKESRLPILRWPGGNFVSAYHWEDGVGPMERRPARPNWAWGGIEPNLFGTDEFVAFCRAVGCEPMICINAGDGTPEEAARWVEYCNGPATSPMGAKRAANGHPEPYNIRYWEVGNELWGRWQKGWSTPAGYADRYGQYAAAMLKADASLRLYGCGAPVLWGRDWNRALIAGGGPLFKRTTDHPLIGGDVSPTVDPLDVHRDFMAVPTILERKWRELWGWMNEARIEEPSLAVTELQLFAHLAALREGEGPARLTHRTLVTPATQAEAMYDTLIYHAAIRLAPFVDMVTQSATVNHGGGLRKERERVYANPCHYAQAAFAAFADAVPVGVEVTGPSERVPFVLPEIKSQGPELTVPTVAALAAADQEGALLVSIVHRGTRPIRLTIDSGRSKGSGTAEVWSLTALEPWAANTINEPTAIQPTVSNVLIEAGTAKFILKPYTVMRVRFAGQQ